MVVTHLLRVGANDGYVDKLVKLVPAEAISAYLALINVAVVSAVTVDGAIQPENVNAGTSAVVSGTGNSPEVYWAFIIALGILAVARIFGSIDVGVNRRFDWKTIDWTMVFISIGAYFIWVYTIGGSSSGPFKDYYSLFWGTALIILFTFLAPYLHTGTTRYFNKTGGLPVAGPSVTGPPTP
jgi:hypothetical protein